MKRHLIRHRILPLILSLFLLLPYAQALAAGRSNGGVTVYVAPNSECYHRKGCTYLTGDTSAMSLGRASKNYRRCSRCHPPIYGKPSPSDNDPYVSDWDGEGGDSWPHSSDSSSSGSTHVADNPTSRPKKKFDFSLIIMIGMAVLFFWCVPLPLFKYVKSDVFPALARKFAHKKALKTKPSAASQKHAVTDNSPARNPAPPYNTRAEAFKLVRKYAELSEMTVSEYCIASWALEFRLTGLSQEVAREKAVKHFSIFFRSCDSEAAYALTSECASRSGMTIEEYINYCVSNNYPTNRPNGK